LLNRLIGRERALVSAEPGTTRDFIEERVIVGPHCLRLIDTAGLNPSPAPLEKLGMEKTREKLAEADLVIVVLDSTNGVFPREDLTTLTADINNLIVFNKSDLRRPEDANQSAVALDGSLRNAIHVSALTGTGIDNLVTAIIQRADSFQQQIGGDVVAVNARHAHALAEARRGLTEAHAKLKAAGAIELVASDLRSVLAAYGEITGKVDNERMLDQLFATFCIGK
jgi:tRNA modification GTPase